MKKINFKLAVKEIYLRIHWTEDHTLWATDIFKFCGSVHRKYIPMYTRVTKMMQLYTVYLYLETALHVSGGTSTHHQERIQLYLQHLVFVTPLLLSAAIVEELQPVW